MIGKIYGCYVIPSALTGFATSIALIAAIGAQNAFVLRQGLRREHVLPVVIVCAASDLLLITAGIAGLGTLLERHPTVVLVARWGGAAFLLGYAALAARRSLRPSALAPAGDSPARLRATIGTCLALTFLNPHVYIDTVLLLGTIGNQQPHRWLFAAGAALASAVWFLGLGLGARSLAGKLARPLTWRILDGVVAVVMTAIAITLIVD